jgi:hypothetical protein
LGHSRKEYNSKISIMKSKLLFSAGLACSLFIASCNKDDRYDPNNGNDQIQLGYQIKAINTSAGTARSTAGAIVWTAGFANPTVIKFEAKQENSKLEYTATHTGQIDLFAFNPVTFGNFTLGAGTYKEIELKLLFKRNGNSPALQLNGQYSGNNMTAPVVLMIEGPLEIKTEQKDVVITENMPYVAVTDMDLASYTDGVTESMWMNADIDNGTILISEDSNENIYWKILSNIKGKKHHCHWHH